MKTYEIDFRIFEHSSVEKVCNQELQNCVTLRAKSCKKMNLLKKKKKKQDLRQEVWLKNFTWKKMV